MKHTSRHSTCSVIESLEPRIAPAGVTFVSPTTATYDDVDGDRVTVKFSKPFLTATNVMVVFSFNAPGHASMDLTTVMTGAVGTDIAVTVAKVAGGDGRADIGTINAQGMDLGKITLPGDVANILAGDLDLATTGVVSLSAESIGRLGNLTGANQQFVEIQGNLGGLTLKSDLGGGGFIVTKNLGFAKIGGSLVGFLSTQGDMGPITIGGDLAATGLAGSGVLLSTGKIASVTIGGSLVGGDSSGTGTIFSVLDCGFIKIAGDVISGRGGSTGVISSSGKLAGLSIGGSLIGGSNINSGLIKVTLDAGPITIGGDIRGGTADGSGRIDALQKLASLKVGGSIMGSSGKQSGSVSVAGEVGAVFIGHNVLGGSGNLSGNIDVKTLTSLTIGGSLRGGSATGDASGRINLTETVTPYAISSIKIGHDIVGGSGPASGSILANNQLTSIASLTIGGSVVGGSGSKSGYVQTGNTTIPKWKVGHDIVGGSGQTSGRFDFARTSTAFVGGSIVGGSGDGSGFLSGSFIATLKVGGEILGGAGKTSGGISANVITQATIGGSIIGGSADNSGSILGINQIGSLKIGGSIVGSSITGNQSSITNAGSVTVAFGKIGSVVVKGSLLAGQDTSNNGALIGSASISAFNTIGSITIGGSIVGTNTASGTTNVFIAAGGQQAGGFPAGVAIGKLTVAGRVELALVLAGFDFTLGSFNAVNADGQIGTVKIGRDLIASSIVAGAIPGPGGFGNMSMPIAGGDAAVLSKIASITIGGRVLGTAANVNSSDKFGIVAEQIGSVKIRGIAVPLTTGAHNNTLLLSPNTDFYVHEI